MQSFGEWFPDVRQHLSARAARKMLQDLDFFGDKLRKGVYHWNGDFNEILMGIYSNGL